ncbi:hypothetical protein BRD15_02150 [Halobacteriales archaeon SW_6_65_15]|jgi:hypothetical protein|nr:MAG: hypothetical protein BRD15_02150 [Halobacteriales archaeon SW_6_65_15]
MRHQRPSNEYGKDGTDSRYDDAGRSSHDEQCLYGEPCHEVQTGRDEQRLYGEPQHETREDSSELPDLELLFVRMRAESGVQPASLSDRSSVSRAETTEQ